MKIKVIMIVLLLSFLAPQLQAEEWPWKRKRSGTSWVKKSNKDAQKGSNKTLKMARKIQKKYGNK
ncbi:hypothetical protein [Rhodonellum sp.]|uniref:hypothetical protein n=1 Tax=Rhodonellum sp. TaxID=2231180 RepID=UPI00272495F0|nr:hypothetical protein [Rhodonellum sp.]MDO9554556.1 hypothetical protein [Rhodonellum sp.]